MIESNRFAPNATYFVVMFEDEELTVPIVQTLLYLEQGKLDNGTECYFFQDLGRNEKCFVRREDADHLVLDGAGLIQKLKDAFDGKLATGAK